MDNNFIIRGGFIVDGSGAPGYTGDIVVRDGIIQAVGPGSVAQSASSSAGGETSAVINAAGMVAAPGFIDMHRHCDLAAFREGFGELELRQGITACVAANCGMAPVPNAPESKAQLANYLQPCLGPFGERDDFSTHRKYAQRLEGAGLPLYMGYFAGMGAIKIAVRGFAPGPLNSAELALAQQYLEDALDSGAFGLSIGLMYIPEAYSSTAEIAALASVMKGGRGILCTHMRWETEELPRAVAEVIAIAKQAEVPLEISHFKAAGRRAWKDTLRRAIDLIEKERAAGMDITVDFYPYDCGSSTMMQMLPPSYLAMGPEEAVAGLANPANVDRMRKLLESGEPGWDNLSQTIGWDRTIVSAVNRGENQKYLGKSVSVSAREYGFKDEAEFVAVLLASEKGRVAIINQSMSPEDIDTIARLPYSSLISDALYGDMKGPHPRLTGAFPRFLRDFVRERKVLSLETAIHKMTARPAARLGLKDRGLLKPGCRADILIFDPAKFRDTSTYTAPMELAAGLHSALLGGVPVLQDGKLIHGHYGGVLRKS